MREHTQRALLVGIIVSAWLAVASASQARPDFSGQWAAEPDAVPAQAGPGAKPAAPPRGTMGSGWGSPITIRQTADELVVEHPLFSRYDLQPPLRHVYKLDGSETQYPILISHTTQIRRARAVWKGGSLEITTTYPGTDPASGKPFTVDVTQRLTMESPTRLVVEVARGAALGGDATTSRTVYQKQ